MNLASDFDRGFRGFHGWKGKSASIRAIRGYTSFAKIEKAGKPGPHLLSAPFVADNWESAKMIPLSKARLSPGWRRLEAGVDPLAKSFGDRLPEVWKATQPGESISFRFRGTTARIYDLLGPDCGQVTIALDDRAPM